MNSIVKMRIKSQFTLLEFIGNFENVPKAIREKENLLDHQDHLGNPTLLTILGIKKSLMGVYTRQVYIEFQTEVQRSLSYVAWLIPSAIMRFF